MPEIRRAVVKSYDAANHKADVQIAGSLAVWLADVRVATNIPAADVIAGRQCTVLFLDPSNQDEAVIIAIQGAAPSGGGGGATTFLGLTDTPSTYAGKALKPARVNAAETDLEFGSTTLIEDDDTDTVVDTEASADEDKVRIKIAGAERGLFQTISPHITLTGDTLLLGWTAIRSAPVADIYLNISPSSGFITASSTTFLSINPASTTINANNAAVFGVFGTPAFIIAAAKTGIQLPGLAYSTFVSGGSAATVSRLRAITAGWGALVYNGTVTDAAGIEIVDNFILAGSPTFPTTYGLLIGNQGHASATDVYAIKINAQLSGANRYALHIADITGGAIARLLELGPTPYLRLLASGEWTPAANETPLYLAEGATPTLRQVKWKDGASIGAGDKVLVLV